MDLKCCESKKNVDGIPMSKPWKGVSEKVKDNSGSERTSFKSKGTEETIICPRYRTQKHQNSLENGSRKIIAIYPKV